MTLIELILYVALISIFISGMVVFAWDFIYSAAKTKVHREVNQNLRLASKRIIYEIRNASQVQSISSSDICLGSATSERNPTRIYSSNGNLHIAWGGGSINCTGMTNDEVLTSNKITVPSLTFSDHSSGSNSSNIQFSLTVTSFGARKEWQKSQTYTGTAEVRTK
ncbi:hypothetical protein A3A93_00950 [Candidatus Roizmanbacteria bacterium RIFCSPLOWO2_01_FULL_38_12]|uniref:General secretion pathway GspH domain-containing protein n=1 Tax=Candidatus Roizmanbacteria bacterium RIFCSPLOWO2_01_FULL_38_12 TaxID=1802061 RepID=A0A1F7IR81_9BACT|nr:MAG: hypothetical protein A2861_01795 [Candidatus Roizmanbacteria bacterium RIFCSPHIGHO2_01_FULL_38_15]OGK34743.1 MAG: hypothetical protein A3F59_04410 [Candidatus Roizmanbacteria bacterium RIFCSPHIGHO2_12_FULL_38_13]OGK45861.1 MAG: hypothetical protein A3A93_00950 [Candidatus Roizmanbacteria bacterium RIFCSPLOWO2_01_FULL_38_12]